MKKLVSFALALILVLGLAAAPQARTADYDPESYYNNGGFNVPGLTFQPSRPDTIGTRFAPTEVFKNVYFIGDTWVCCMLYVTDNGDIIMWDALEYNVDYEDILLPDMQQFGLDPSRITTVFLSHGHFDHIGLSGMIEEMNQAQVYICKDDEELMLSNAKKYEESGTPLPKNYKFYGDGDVITVNNVTFTFMHTPGHTAGSMSFFVPVEDFEGNMHTLCCWGGTSAPRDADGTKTYLASIEKFKEYVDANHVDAFLSMHPFVDYSTNNVAMVRETHSSDALIKTPEQMDFFLQGLSVYTASKGKLAQMGITEFTHDGFGSKVLAFPYTVYIPEEENGNGAFYLNQNFKAEIFDDVYFIGNGTNATLIFDTGEGLVLVDAMTGTADFTDIVAPAMAEFDLDPANIKAVLVTTGKADKYGFAQYLKDTYGAQIYMNELDLDTAKNDYPSALAAGKFTAIPEIDTDLVEGDYTFGNFTFRFMHTPGHTPGTMSFLVDVAIKGKAHTAALFGGSTFNYEKAALQQYVDSTARFLEAAKEAGADAVLATHPYMDYSVDKVLDLLNGNAEAFILTGKNDVAFYLSCINLTAAYKLKYDAI